MDVEYKKYGSIFFVLIICYLSYIIIKPFFSSIILSAIISYLFYPLFKKLNNKLSKNLSTFIIIFLVIIIIIIPLFFLSNSLIRDIPKMYMLFSSDLNNSGLLNKVYVALSESPLNINLKNSVQISMNSILNYLKNFLFSIPEKLINISLAFFLLFFFIRDGEMISKKLFLVFPFNEKEKLILFRELKNMIDAIIYGQFITALIQFILATLAYYVLGFEAALFFGILTFFLSTIPMIGPSFVYFPLGISSIINGLMIHNNFEIIRGIILLIFGFVIISSVDNVIKPLVISDKVNIHPIFLLIGILGGIYAFGFIGIIIGPIVLVLLITIFKIKVMREDIVEHFEHPAKKNKEIEI